MSTRCTCWPDSNYCCLLLSARREMIKVGDRVRVKPSVTTPKYKWGSVNHSSVGTVVSISPNGKDVKVDFPQQTNWTGLISEMEVVPATHPRIRSENLSSWAFVSFLLLGSSAIY